MLLPIWANRVSPGPEGRYRWGAPPPQEHLQALVKTGCPREDGSVLKCSGQRATTGRAQVPCGYEAGAENTPFRFGVLTVA